jgi:hypothetical protein
MTTEIIKSDGESAILENPSPVLYSGENLRSVQVTDGSTYDVLCSRFNFNILPYLDYGFDTVLTVKCAKVEVGPNKNNIGLASEREVFYVPHNATLNLTDSAVSSVKYTDPQGSVKESEKLVPRNPLARFFAR